MHKGRGGMSCKDMKKYEKFAARLQSLHCPTSYYTVIYPKSNALVGWSNPFSGSGEFPDLPLSASQALAGRVVSPWHSQGMVVAEPCQNGRCHKSSNSDNTATTTIALLQGINSKRVILVYQDKDMDS